MRVEASTFVVAGGASGLGAATARLLGAEGGNVLIADQNETEGAALADDLGARALFIKTDVTDERSGSACIAAALTRFGGVQGLVNCAGIVVGEKVLGKDGPHDFAKFRRVIEVNLVGSFNMIRLAASAMVSNAPNDEGERGVMINTASVAAFDGQIGQAAYSASKAGLVGLTLPVARELARHGIRMMTIAPGLFETPMMAGMTQEVRDSLAKMIPFPSRLGRPGEFASLVREIITNPMLNGEVIRLDGAIRLAPR